MSELTKRLNVDVARAERIIVPSGDDNERCIESFQKEFDIEIPEFEGKSRKVVSGGKTFFKLKGIDIPGYVAGGYADIGLTGTDSAKENQGYGRDFVVTPIESRPMCTFMILAREDCVAWGLSLFSGSGREEVQELATSFPRNLMRAAARLCLPAIPSGVPVTGGVEGAAELLGLPFAADLVVTGESALANNMVPIKLLDEIYPAIITPATSVPGREEPFCASR